MGIPQTVWVLRIGHAPKDIRITVYGLTEYFEAWKREVTRPYGVSSMMRRSCSGEMSA